MKECQFYIRKEKLYPQPYQIHFQMLQLYQTQQLQLAFKSLYPTKVKQPKASCQVEGAVRPTILKETI